MPRSMKTDQNQFVLKWMTLLPNDYQKPLSKHSQKLFHCQYNSWNTSSFRHHPNPRTILVWNPKDSEYFELRREISHGYLPPSQLDLFYKNSFKQQRFPESHYLYQHSSFFSSFFFYAKTSLTTETSVLFFFSTTMFAIIFWTFTLTHHIRL